MESKNIIVIFMAVLIFISISASIGLYLATPESSESSGSSIKPPTDCPIARFVYQDQNADIGNPTNVWYTRPYDHFVQFGQKEGRTWSSSSCVPQSTLADCPLARRVYKRMNADIGTPSNFWYNRPYDHFIEHGQKEGRIWPNAVCGL